MKLFCSFTSFVTPDFKLYEGFTVSDNVNQGIYLNTFQKYIRYRQK